MTETLTPKEHAPDGGVTSAATHAKLDLLEAWLREVGPVEPPEPVHRFTPGLYARELTMPAGLLLTSKVHRTEHQYVVSRGVALVFVDGEGWRKIVAPYHGITRAGTRRVLRILEETTWTTFHPILPEEDGDVAAIEARIIEPHVPVHIEAGDIHFLEEEIDRWQRQQGGES